MVLIKTPICNFGEKPQPFSLKGVDNKIYKLDDCLGNNGTIIMFICNHCPYVKAIISDIVKDTNRLKNFGISSVAIMSNDTKNYPEDSFEKMREFSKVNNFNFPYVIDETQEVAKKYGAVCTPDFFGYNGKKELQYRGRMRELKNLKLVNNNETDLFKSMKLVSETGKGPENQIPSMGCNIKWFN